MKRPALLTAACVLASGFSPASAQSNLPPGGRPPAGEPAGAALAGTRSPSYRINSGDELEIYVWGEERLQRAVKVLPDGTLAFPLVGQIVAQGRLPQELEQVISSALADQYRGEVPQVTVSVVAPAGLQFSVIGRVQAPGTFTPGRYINVLEALSMAGGPNEFANLNDIVIIRKQGDAVRAVPVRVASLFKTGASSSAVDRSDILRIESGDTIIVP